MRASDGDWQIFIEHEPGKFEPKKVELVDEKGPWKVIRGVKEGTEYVDNGAFSFALKSLKAVLTHITTNRRLYVSAHYSVCCR